MVRVVVVVIAGLVAALGSGCQDPCVTLAERICNCEKTADERRACITDRVSNQQSSVEVSDADRAFCQAILDDGTCTCAALDENDLAACGFANGDGE
jgi:hypothetical protein